MPDPIIVVDTFNHIAFPPKLPGKRDEQPAKVNLDLIIRLRHAVQTLHRMADDDMKVVWQCIEVALNTCHVVNENGMVNKVALLNAFDKLHPESAVIVYIAEQNAALLFRKAQGSDDVIIEGFEASPSAEQTLAASGALKWHFPGTAISLSGKEFGSSDLQESLATFLEMASTEQIDEFAAKSRKAGVEVAESRDVVDPALIYEFLITLLGVNGCRISPPLLCKRIRDDVCWDNSELPWRRSPFWLVLRFLLCVVLALLLNDVTNTSAVSVENWSWLKAKLCRRLVKLEMGKEHSPSAYVVNSDIAIKKEWEAFKKAVQRKVPLLPLYAQPRDMSLNSAALAERARGNTTDQFASLSIEYSSLANLELELRSGSRESPTSNHKSQKLCIDVAQQINQYIDLTGNAYNGDQEQLSEFILNIFELWVYMDKCAVVTYPLLEEYHPGFQPELLDVLYLSRLTDLEHPSPECFADRYLRTSMGKDLIARSSCTQRRHPDGTHDIRGCSHCYHIRCRRRLQISVHEDYLPSGNRIAEKRAIVFELAIPEAFAAYRGTTWNIINRLGPHVDLTKTEEPRVLLEDYNQLANYKRNIHCQGRLSLASYTKTYLGTHYKWKKLPAASKDVLLPQGLAFRYYDAERRLWSKDRAPFTLSQHFAISLPPSNPFASLYSSSSFAPEGSGPSSYEAISKVRDCPSTVTVHEFMAHQALMAGKHRRWISILIELGSSNINLSSLETMFLLRHLALQAGPGTLNDTLRITHSVFREAGFCKRLIEQIHQHLSIIATNWRETTYMETMLTLTIQLCNLGCHETSTEANNLLRRIRSLTLQWINHLRNETRNASEVDVAERAARYCFLAALLCRRTFSVYCDTHVPLDMESAQCFIEATLALQESLVVDLTKFSNFTRSMLVRDIKMSARLRQIIQSTVRIHPSSINCVLDKVFHFHLLEGHLLVDGKALGKLPADIRDSETLRGLFGNQRLIAFPSNMPGMNYVLALDREGHQIHLGYRNKNLVIRALKDGRIFELIPRSVFERNGKFDLPVPLIFDCVHWINLNSGILEARRMPLIWRERPGNWKINLAISIAEIFHHFEHPSMLTIYQPAINTLSIELKRMNLGFHVNKRQLLQCKQLAAEVDPNQDAGTLYGLQSMLVLRNAYNRSQRSIITPLGKLEYERHGIHVLVRKGNNGDYGRYMIDDVLGRLHGPVEPLLLYTLAQLHAFTSFTIPDPLTGRTGTEEALSYLRSGYSQPWTPLGQGSIDLLQKVLCLAPHREYYPQGVKRQQLVKWDPNLTVSIQHEAYQPIIQSILSKSQRLSLFQVQATHPSIDTAKGDVHLQERACWRRCLYERTDASCPDTIELPDVIYTSRFRYCSSKQASRVREIVTLIKERPSKLYTTHKLSSILKKWSYIGGYTDIFTSYSLERTLFVDFAAEWGKLVCLCIDSDMQNPHSLMFCLGLMAYGDGVDLDLIRVLAAFSILDDLKQLSLPLYSSFETFRDQGCPEFDSVLSLVQPFCTKYKDPTPQKKVKQAQKAAEVARIQLAKEHHDKQCAQESKFSASFLNVVGALDAVSHDWLRRYKNMRLAAHINDVQKVLNAHTAKRNNLGDPPAISQPAVFRSQCLSSRNVAPKLGQDLISKSGPKLESNINFSSKRDDQGIINSAAHQLNVFNRKLLSKWKAAWTPELNEIERIDLQLSITALKEKGENPEISYRSDMPYHEGMARCDANIRKARAIVDRYHRQICDTFTVGDPRFLWLQNGNLWPCTTPVTILQQLRSTACTKFGPNMKEALLSYGVAIVRLQRLDQEHCQASHSTWDYIAFPDWVLLEIDSNMQIRQEQVTVALEMVSPASGSNTVLQMNMGQGKTSILQARLGGLVGRSLVYIPFSRRTPITSRVIGEYRALQESMLRESGIVLGNPEHTLSFKLSGRQLVSDLKIPQAVEMVEIQDWIDRVAHDILDECDFTLAVKTQLIYPGGSQLAVDGHPDRWEVIMAVLELVAQHLCDLARELPYSIDIIERAASAFPIAHLLREDAETALIERVVKDVCSGRSAILPIQGCKDFEVEAIRQFISRQLVDRAVVEYINGLFQDMPKIRKRIYLLRGILVHRILLLCLKKRWNVQYGLHPSRDPMAVPFHAKGVPSDHAEWGHPDVAILFTCLAFYHEGLTQEQCRRSLQSILQSDDPATAYERLTQRSGTTFPEALRHWNLINIDDHGQVAEIWYHLRFSITAINYFLKTLVFPVHAKQFSIKLQSSGWDVPFFKNSSILCQDQQKKRSGLTTGFSGTNDNRRLLPLTIQQRDLPELLHTNAEVLTYLLQKRNRGYRHAVVDGKRFTEAELLKNLTRSGIRILIDAGAYILEMDNRTLVRTWLDQDTEVQAAVYFGRDNQAWVQYRTGRTVPLFATPFADNLKDCLVYLDESHTRGTDLKLPADARGALTLGLNQSKDHTVQAAMRLRQLGQTQSVIFIAPPEVHQNILDVCKKGRGDTIDSSDVVYWLLFQTCANNRDLQPLFYAQGADFCRRVQAAAQYPKFLSDPLQREAYIGVLQQPEQQTLEQLYKPQILDIDVKEPTMGASPFPFSGRVAEFMQVLRQQHQQSKFIQDSIVGSALEEVEQEREVAYEIEEEREIQRPRRLEAHHFPGLHPSLSRFAKTGVLKRSKFISAAHVLSTTSLGLKYGGEVTALLPRLCVSSEFTKTVKLRPGERRDEFMRPVTWLLCNIATEAVIIVTPEEAEELIPILRTTPAPSMHLITYAAPVTKRMLHFSYLNYYAIPSFPTQCAIPYWLSLEVGIFAGRLYFAYTDYTCLLQQVQPEPEEQTSKGLLTTRRTAQMSLLEEWTLSVDHAFFETARVQNTEPIFHSSGYTVGREEEEEYYDSEEEEVGILATEEGDQVE
ncbi:Protein of unknown function DUF3638 [Aspergillus parasiticus SU-1]|uniref:ubiquitinyl hydrolase 1 n=1 Tax=Aspergillus parasiticus (strain ATCC 56775 / NRRL 5862 / SRRC 143 / SU-1) TaxID=1403190 RepID=A0A0F0IBB4_ASPPU|nr:Protein of unknown function DUF3638 [Aspergillus parasiticus SU-1]